MRVTLLVHVVAGGLAIVSGYAALYAAKGAGLHRRAGIVFVGSMVTMGVFGAGLAAARAEPGNVIGGLLAAYLVVTALTTVRTPTAGSRQLDAGAMLAALAIGLAGIALAGEALVLGDGTLDGVPAGVFLAFAAVALLSGVSDLRVMRAGGIRGPRRLARHLWRMCLALFIAAGSFFLGQADVIPERLRVLPLLALASFLPLLAVPYWLWRVRTGRKLRRVGGGASKVGPPGAGLPARAG